MSLIRLATQRPVRRSTKETQLSVKTARHAIAEMSDQSEASLGELVLRASQFQELLSIAYVVRAVMKKADNGSVSQTDLDRLTPPKIKGVSNSGTLQAFEYIRDTLIDTRQMVTSLYNEARDTSIKLTRLEQDVQEKSTTGVALARTFETKTLTMGSIADLLEEFEHSEQDD